MEDAPDGALRTFEPERGSSGVPDDEEPGTRAREANPAASSENTSGATGWCHEVPDIAVAKYFANREKDRRVSARKRPSTCLRLASLRAPRARDTGLGTGPN